MKQSLVFSIGLVIAGILGSPAFAAVNIDWVTIGDAGNTADNVTGYGAVGHEYKIARNETTIAQYVEFLNAVAATDSYGLYSANMASNANIAGIQRIGTSGSYSYAAIGSDNRPITYVSWFDAARFVNWLHNGQGSGSTESGAYNLNGATSGIFTVEPGATVWLPTQDEWYKAAYYDPTKYGNTGGYWLYPNQSDNMPGNDLTIAGAANYYAGDHATTPGNGTYSPSQDYLTDVGAYGMDSQSHYGTNDQGGNVWEWNDAVSGLSRGLRGGSFDIDVLILRSTSTSYYSPASEYYDAGFRIAGIPEASASLLTVLSSFAMFIRQRR